MKSGHGVWLYKPNLCTSSFAWTLRRD